MERRGSGFKKICHDYESQANYKEELRPAFYSTYNDFVLTLYNLNYKVENGEVPQSSPKFPKVPQSSPKFPKVPQSSPKFPKVPQSSPNLPEHLMQFLNVLRRFPGGTVELLAKETDVSNRMIKRYLQVLRELQLIRRVGSNRKGYWEIIKHKEE